MIQQLNSNFIGVGFTHHTTKNGIHFSEKKIITLSRSRHRYYYYNPAETKPCKVTIPIKTFSSLITGKNCTADGGASIFFMASTAIASGPMTFGFLT